MHHSVTLSFLRTQRITTRSPTLRRKSGEIHATTVSQDERESAAHQHEHSSAARRLLLVKQNELQARRRRVLLLPDDRDPTLQRGRKSEEIGSDTQEHTKSLHISTISLFSAAKPNKSHLLLTYSSQTQTSSLTSASPKQTRTRLVSTSGTFIEDDPLTLLASSPRTLFGICGMTKQGSHQHVAVWCERRGSCLYARVNERRLS